MSNGSDPPCWGAPGGTQMMVDVHRGNELACLSTPSFVERLKELLILLLEVLILHCYLVVLSF